MLFYNGLYGLIWRRIRRDDLLMKRSRWKPFLFVARGVDKGKRCVGGGTGSLPRETQGRRRPAVVFR